MNVQRFLHTIDGISTWVGKTAAWLIIALTTVVCVEVFTLHSQCADCMDFRSR
jgi:TRAP-type mannitol/chloroaromatic compound transport system permease small subunit